MVAALAIALCAVPSPPARAARVKDFASVKGVRPNQIIGYGLVVGLAGTGDKPQTEFTVQSLSSMLSKMGIGVDPDNVKVKNVAAVMVTAKLPAFARTGSRIDILVSSLGDATSLEGGTLVMTPLLGTDGNVYAVAQGPISVNGFAVSGSGGSSVQKNHPTVGRIANGATVEREIPYWIDGKREFELALGAPDFTTALRTAKAINRHFKVAVADARDAGTLTLRVPEAFADDVVGFMARVEGLEVKPDVRARVVLNERTGTVVMGAQVRIDTVAVSHGSLSVTISATNQVSQPLPFSDGVTTPVVNEDISAVEESGGLVVLDGPVTIGELVRGLNAMGVTPRDLIAILQAVKTAGALSADLEMM
ncbi:MAG: flagellar basal body P-ring protein FlgI [Myxococcales bacterium]|nr:flagellar basal body P-ring protein FlgI [Myxococcales bacterium]